MRRSVMGVGLAIALSTAGLGQGAAAAALPSAASYLDAGSGWKRYPDITPVGDAFFLFTTKSGFGAVVEADGVVSVHSSRNGVRWTPAPRAAGGFTGEVDISGVATGDGQVVAFGSTGPEELRTPTFWTSRDGRAWTMTVGSTAAFGDPAENVFVNDVVRGKGKWVAVGGDASGGTLVPAVWTSKDAKVWTRVAASGDLVTTDTTFLRGVASRGSSYVAVGAKRDTEPGGDTFDEVAVAYTSSNGTTWQRASSVAVPAAAETTDALNPSTVRRIVAEGVVYAAGQVVIWGSGTDALSEGAVSRTPFVVLSKNGTGGKGTVLPGATGTRELWAVSEVAATGKTIVAVGYHAEPNVSAGTAVWVSKDAGKRWKLLRGKVFDLPAGRTFGGATHLSASQQGILVTGVAAGGGPSRPIAWVAGKP